MSSPQRPSLAGVNILLVDDYPDTLDMVREGLSACGATVAAVGSAGEALTIFPSRRFDVLVTDIAMPEHDGVWLVDRIRAGSFNQNVPVVVMTGLGMPTDERRARTSFAAWLLKPVDPVSLARTVDDLLHPRRPGQRV